MTEQKIQRLPKRMGYLLNRLERDTSESRKTIAYLRRAPDSLADATDAWEFIYRGQEDDETLTDAESEAVYAALRFYALHKRKLAMPHQKESDGGKRIFSLLAAYRKTKSGANIDSKVSAILVASDAARALGLLEPLFIRAVGETTVPLDYISLARQFHSLQNPAFKRKTLLGWGKDYYQNTFNKKEEK